MGLSVKDNIQKFLGYLIGSVGVLMMLLGIAMYFTSAAQEEIDAGRGIAIFSISLLLIAAALLYTGYRNSLFEEQVETAASIIRTYRRITLLNLAEKMHCSVPHAGKVLAKVISLQLVKGNFDRTTDEFFTEEGKYHRTDFKFCPACGAPFNSKFLEGDTIKCGSCGAVI
ncbi:MAG: zinc ribbon domain-containing protein [Spirochaetes bacterium]|nr:zinc ribbon domain-containing protein [Spirochaetota bacterium]